MNIEQQHQEAVVNYLKVRYPYVLFTIAPNGMKLPIGVAVKLKRMGYSKGTPDIMIFEPKTEIICSPPLNDNQTISSERTFKIYHGLFIELKTPKIKEIGQKAGTLSPEQIQWIDVLNIKGYKAEVCYGSNEAIEIIDKYLSKESYDKK